ncbi:putative porin [Haliea sp. E17]|uniref:putative porin n=1 Tax=Haliea sp. E17 TaxID=3401576 RepID=UPI003AB02C57
MFARKAVFAACAALVYSSTSYAVSDVEWEQFKQKFLEMEARVQTLEAENARLRDHASVPVEDLEQLQGRVASIEEARQSSWTESIGMKGDFRYRYESIDVEDVDRRERYRIRARLSLNAALPNDVDVGFGLSTGGDDPVSGNQTLGGGGSRKEIRLDKAYAKWNLTQDFALIGGKFSNPLYRPEDSALMWDGDWRPEGIAATWRHDSIFVNFLGDWLESDSATGNDEFAWGLQGGTVFGIGDARLTTALGYFDFPTAGNGPFYDDSFYGNSSVNDTYLYNYEVIEAIAELSLSVADLPLTIYADVVQNQDVSDHENGWQAGIVLGKLGGWGSWDVGYAYQDLEADAVLGLLSDSDFAGGGTDGKGQRITGNMGINKQWSLGFTWYLNNEAGEVNRADRGGALSYDRFIVDTQFKY